MRKETKRSENRSSQWGDKFLSFYVLELSPNHALLCRRKAFPVVSGADHSIVLLLLLLLMSLALPRMMSWAGASIITRPSRLLT